MRSTFALASLLCLATLCCGADQQGAQGIDLALQKVNGQPDSEAARLDLASQYLQIGLYKAAAETLQEYLGRHTGSVKPLRLLALARLQQEDYQAAKDAAATALRTG